MRTSTLTGPAGFTAITRLENKITNTIFGDSMDVPMGRELPVAGAYTFTAVPDNFASKAMSITFSIKRETVLKIDVMYYQRLWY